MADTKIKAFFKGILKANTVTKSDFDKAMKEKYDCKNPVLLKAFQKADGFIYAKDGILRAVITTWTHGDKLAKCIG